MERLMEPMRRQTPATGLMLASRPRISALSMAAIAVGLLVVVGIGAYGVTCLSDYEVVDKGQLLEYTEATIWKVEFCGRHTVLLEAEKRPDADWVNASLLLSAGVLALGYAYVIRRMTGGTPARLRWMAGLTFAGMLFLAADESFGFHETAGHNLGFLGGLPLVSRPDDVIIASYAVPALLFLWFFRHEVFVDRFATRLVAWAAGLFVLAAASDVAGFRFEEIFELASSALLVWGLARIWTVHVDRCARPGRDPATVLAAHRPD